MNAADLITYLTKKRFDSLNASEKTLKRVLKSAPNLPTAAIWLLQKCAILPTEADLKRWSEDVAKLKAKPAKTAPVNEVKTPVVNGANAPVV